MTRPRGARTAVARSRRCLAALLVALGVCGAHGSAAADTFLLKDGARVQGELAEEVAGPDRKPWLVVRTPFGSTRFPKKALRKQLRLDVAARPLVCTSIMVTTLKGVVERSGDGGAHWTAISPRSRDGRTLADLPVNTPNSVVAPGQWVRTGADGEIDLDLGWGVVHVASSSTVSFGTADESTMRVHVGEIGGRLDALPAGGEFRVETPQASMGVRGTTFSVGVAPAAARFAVEEGAVVVGERRVTAGRALTVGADGTATEREPDARERRILGRLRDTFSIPRIDRIRVPGGRMDFRGGGPSTTVTIPAFELARTEVTVAQLREFEAWIDKHGDHYFCHPDEPAGARHSVLTLGRRAGEHPRLQEWQREQLTGDQQPAVGVTWFTAYAFCAWIGARLPSETTWTWAAQGASSDPLSDAAAVLEQSWVLENSGAIDLPAPGAAWPDDPSTIRRTHPVGTRKPNRLGLHDMLGNAEEWVYDRERPPGAQVPNDGSPWLPAPGSEVPDPDPAGSGGVRLRLGGEYATPAASAAAARAVTYALGPGAGTGFRPEFRDR